MFFITSLTSNSLLVFKSPPKTSIHIRYFVNTFLKKKLEASDLFSPVLFYGCFFFFLQLSPPGFSLHHRGGGGGSFFLIPGLDLLLPIFYAVLPHLLELIPP